MYNSTFIPIKPISINSCFVGRRFRTKDFIKWQEAVGYSLPAGKVSGKHLGTRIWFYLEHPTKQDGDNLIKAVIDSCVKNGIITDDRHIEYYEIFKKRAKSKNGEGFEIEFFAVK